MNNLNDNSNNTKKERQSIRETYKQLVEDVKRCINENDMDGINHICDEMQKLYTYVKHTREALLDITLMNHLANYSYKKIQTIETNFLIFDTKTFIKKLLEYNSDDLKSRFCKVAYAPIIPFIDIDELAIANMEQKSTKRRTSHHNEKPNNLDLVKVAKLSDNEIQSTITEDTNFSLNIIRIYDMVEQLIKSGMRSVYLCDILAKAKDFSQAIDFNFCVAFLVRDGRLKMKSMSNDITTVTLKINDINNGKTKQEIGNNITNFQQADKIRR